MNPSIIYRRFGGIYRSATGRRPAVRPNRPVIVRHSAPIVRCDRSRHSPDCPPIIQPNRPIIDRRFGGIYRCRLGPSGLDFDNLPEDQKRVINNLPAMLYHGVNTEPAVLMRMNAVPRSIAVGIGERFSANVKEGTDLHSVRSARSFLRGLSPTDWQRSAPAHAKMSGDD